MAKILIVDDESSIRRTLKEILEFEKYVVHEASDGLECIAKVKQEKYDVLIMDIKMPKMDGMEALDKIQILAPETPVIMISGHANIDNAVEAVKRGAFDFISKPPDLNRLLITIRNAMDRTTLLTETKVLKRRVSSNKVQEIVGESESIKKIKETIEIVAKTNARVLVTGANGAGKELVARWLHEKSPRADKPIIEVNCAAIPSELIESELFGHIKGSFTGAVKDHAGKFEQANGGTIFLDEIGDMSLQAQAKVLRALETKKVTRVGDTKDIEVDVRVISATNKNLLKEIEAGNFREDLYHRLTIIHIDVPPLHERREDIPMLAKHFMNMICDDYGFPAKNITPIAMALLQDLSWKGNIRELRNVIERLIILSGTEVTDKDVLKYVIPAGQNAKLSKIKFKDLFDKFEKVDDLHKYIEEEYLKYKGVEI